MSETSLLTGLPRAQNPCLSQGFLHLSLYPSTRRGMQTLWQEAERSHGNTLESSVLNLEAGFPLTPKDELREVCSFPRCPFAAGHTRLWGTKPKSYPVSGLQSSILRDVIWPPRPIPGSVFAFGNTFFHRRKLLAGKPLCAQEWLHVATLSLAEKAAASLQLSWVAARGSRRRCFIPCPSLLWVPDLHKRTDAKFSMFLVLPAAFFN